MRFITFGLIFLPLCCLSGRAFAATRNCDGYSVTDSAIIDSTLTAQLAKTQDTASLDFSVGFWWPGTKPISDSCSNAGVNCSDTTTEHDTISINYWKIWSQDLFTKYEIYLSEAPTHRVTADVEFSISDHYRFIRAKKSTIVAISKECYVWEMNAKDTVTIPDLVKTPFRGSIRNGKPISRFNIKGQKVQPGIKSSMRIQSSPIIAR